MQISTKSKPLMQISTKKTSMKALSKIQIQILGGNKKSINMAFHERDILQCQLQSL